MVTEKELMEGIAKCIIGEPTPTKMLELASYYIVRENLFGEVEPTYSTSPPPKEQVETISTSGSTEFLKAVNGLDVIPVMVIMDELMDTMKMIQPRIYDSVIRKIREL